MAPQTQQAQQLPPGALFGVPGFTQPTEQSDNNDGFTMALSTTNTTSTKSKGLQNFKQTDLVNHWELSVELDQTNVAGTSAITTSPYFPWNYLQSTVLSVQNLFKPIEVPSGIDLAIFQALRPMRQNPGGQNVLFAAPQSAYQAAAIAQANLVTETGDTFTTAAIHLPVEFPASLYFDLYYHMDKTGNLIRGVPQPQRAIVSPLYMAGSARYVAPEIVVAPGSVSNLDQGPFNIGAGTGTFSTNWLLRRVRRVGFYGSDNKLVLPPVMSPWQYRRAATQFGLGGTSKIDIPLQAVAQPGQILSNYVRLWDPAANGGLGAPIDIANVTVCQVQYGSKLLRYDDVPFLAQQRILAQHNVLLPKGVLAWDYALDRYGRVCNNEAINTLTTAGCQIHLEFSSAVSSSAYAVVGTEQLVVVE